MITITTAFKANEVAMGYARYWSSIGGFAKSKGAKKINTSLISILTPYEAKNNHILFKDGYLILS